MVNELIEEKESWIIPIEGRTVTRCYIDFAFGIELWTREDYFSIRIGGKFMYEDKNGQSLLSPDDPVALCPAVNVFNSQIVSAIAFKTGKLVVDFSNNARISVEADDKYEAWTLVGG